MVLHCDLSRATLLPCSLPAHTIFILRSSAIQNTTNTNTNAVNAVHIIDGQGGTVHAEGDGGAELVVGHEGSGPSCGVSVLPRPVERETTNTQTSESVHSNHPRALHEIYNIATSAVDKIHMPIMSRLRKERLEQANKEDGMDAASVPIIAPSEALNLQHLLCPIFGQTG